MEDKNIKNKYAYPEDLSMAEVAAAEMSLPWNAHVLDLKEAEQLLLQCAPVVADLNSVKASVAMTMLSACKMAARDNLSVVLSGLGSEEAFAGYQRHVRACGAGDVATRRDRTLGLAQMWHRDLQRDWAVARLAKVEIRYPFLDADLLAIALNLPSGEFLGRSRPRGPAGAGAEAEACADGGKGALRAVARSLGAPQRVSERRKRAAQYGSRIYNALKILSNEAGKQQEDSRYHQANYVMSVPGASHSPIALLHTSGYHSIQVYCLLRSWRCQIACIIPPSDQDSDYAAAKAFAASLQLPLLRCAVRCSEGYEMAGLMEFQIEAAACGHVCDLDLWGSFAAACDAVSLRAMAPEWGSCPSNQSSMRRIVHDGTALQLTKFPLSSWLGHTISSPEEADAVLDALQTICGPDATDDTDAGYVDCDFVSSPFLPCGVRDVRDKSVALVSALLQQKRLCFQSHVHGLFQVLV
ncbi:unnamed protein product [Durusdinium trenchii]|uniref:Asparagine synthetase domain-containing protein n=1 Tax=Durusdinium trenchii TaxID=1381693 RepID=A0ABP0P5C5_9DINO